MEINSEHKPTVKTENHIVKNAVRCSICNSPADRHGNIYVCQNKTAHMGDIFSGLFTDLSRD